MRYAAIDHGARTEGRAKSARPVGAVRALPVQGTGNWDVISNLVANRWLGVSKADKAEIGQCRVGG
ncbi:hypothetical protein MWU63_11345 [Pseudohalocynthiibacter sp. F2068]|jgi:hypothetical protein|nr:hypothetical protein [Pseudohalocynthiibacter sp. F2068]